MKVGIIGAGGVGAYFAAALSRAGHEIHLLVTPRHLAPIAKHGIRLTIGDGRDEFIPVAGVSTDAATIGECEAVIVACKAGHVGEVMKSALPLLGAQTPVLPLQNGVTASEQIAASAGRGHALGGLCMIISFLVEPGHVHHVGGQPAVTLGELDRTHPQTRALVEDAMREVATIAVAAGANLTNDDVRTTMGQYDAFSPDSTASMQRDLIAGRPSELEEQSGALVRLAAQYNLAAPIHTTIYRALSILDAAPTARPTAPASDPVAAR